MNTSLRSFLATAGLLVAAVFGAMPAWCATVTLNEGDTLDWEANKPGKDDTIVANGGTIIFHSKVNVPNEFDLNGKVTVNIASGISVRFCGSFLKKTTAGQMVFSDSVTFGNTSSSSFSFLSADSIAFAEGAPSDAKVTLKGFVSMTDLPESWGLPVEYAKDVYLTFYGNDMNPESMDMYTILENSTLRLTSPTNLRAGTKVKVPSTSTLVYRSMKFLPNSFAGSAVSTGTTYGSNDVVMAGGTFSIRTRSTLHYFGNVTGNGTIERGGNSDCSKVMYFAGALAEMDPSSRLLLKYNTDTDENNNVRIKSNFPGTLEFETSPMYTNIVSFGFIPFDPNDPTSTSSSETNEVWSIGAIKGCEYIFKDGTKGARLQYQKKQKIRVGTLSGKLIAQATGSTGDSNMDDLEVEKVEDNTEIYVQYGLRIVFGTVGRGVKLFFTKDQKNSSTITVENGAIAEIGFLGDEVQAKPVTLNCDVDSITGKGKVIVSEGNRRIGATDETVTVDVQGGTVDFGNGVDLSSVLGSRPAIWLDASDTAKMVGAYNEGWAADKGKTVLAAHPAVTFNGSTTATYTNGFPLIEKWYDKRPEQTLTYGWQDRCSGFDKSFYTLVYPYLVPNGLNGRAYMSFGEHGMTDLDETFGTSSGTPSRQSYRRERRRMPLMHDRATVSGKDKPQGDNIDSCALIVVFGSQQGGGRAIVGGYQGNDRYGKDDNKNKDLGSTYGNTSCTAKYLRGGTSNDFDVAQALFKNKKGGGNAIKTVWIDGEPVDPSDTGLLNGDWQIISVTNNANTFRSLGEGEDNDESENSGGQNYAEVISFTNAITAAERQAVENYLAVKWGLVNAQSVKGSVTVAKGATVKGAVANVSGRGTWELNAPESVTLNGASFEGTVAGNGTVAVADASQLPKLGEGFSGGVAVTGSNLEFTYADGQFTPSLVMPERDMEFPAAMTVKVNGSVPAGEHVIASGKTLTGLDTERCTLEIGRTARLVKRGNELILRVIPGTQVIFR